jgi:hypothetical protein
VLLRGYVRGYQTLGLQGEWALLSVICCRAAQPRFSEKLLTFDLFFFCICYSFWNQQVVRAVESSRGAGCSTQPAAAGEEALSSN